MPQLSFHTPLGALTLSQDGDAIVALDWGWGRDQTQTTLLLRARDQMQAYFDGMLTAFDVPLMPAGTPYRQRVWKALCRIPYGATRSYLQIAGQAGGSPRSVGGANGANPIPIIIPCHRVVATTGIGGYSGGEGLATKRYLLMLEQRQHPPVTQESV
jgi:methylated-DNA-[protein]-cysteine S-methyltransferase